MLTFAERRITLHVAALSSLLLATTGCLQREIQRETSRAARIRFEVQAALESLEQGTGQGMPVFLVVRRINIELGRENNGLGEHFATVESLRDGLMALEQTPRDQRPGKIQALNELAMQLPTLDL